MKRFILEPVDNGLIKTVIDDNSDGAGKVIEEKKIYILNDLVQNSYALIKDIIDDLGLFVGNDYDKDKLYLETNFGSKYNLNQTEITEERKRLTHRLSELQSMNTNMNSILNVYGKKEVDN